MPWPIRLILLAVTIASTPIVHTVTRTTIGLAATTLGRADHTHTPRREEE